MSGKARQMMPLIEGVFADEGQLGASLTLNGYEAFRTALLKPFEGHALNILAYAAIREGHLLAQTAAKETQERLLVPRERLASILLANPVLLKPSMIEDDGYSEFEYHLNFNPGRKLHISFPGGTDRLPALSWAGFDFEPFESNERGCPAHQLPLSPYLPTGNQRLPEGVNPPVNFLEQFFRASIEVVVNEIPN